jgi:ribose transport system ATP-binding protein
VMDEPTSSLAHADVARLFEVIARLSARGVSVIYISHALEEVERVASRFTVLRDGSSVLSGVLADTTRAQIIEAMVGRKLGDAFPPRTPHAFGEPVLELRELGGATLPESASLCLRRGEILGIAGLVGAGRSELLRALYGLDRLVRGDVRIASVLDHGAPPWVRLAQGVGMLSEQRKEEGLALGLSVADNVTLAAPEKCSRYGFIVRSRQRALAETQRSALDVRCADVTQPVGSLSGGNQQKVALARLLVCDADILLLDEPTRGIDIRTKLEIYKRITELARGGKAVLMVSSYLPELLGVCDSLAVMRRGRLGPSRPIGEWSEAAVMREAMGA